VEASEDKDDVFYESRTTPNATRGKDTPAMTFELAQQSCFKQCFKKGVEVSSKVAIMARMGMAQYSKLCKVACSHRTKLLLYNFSYQCGKALWGVSLNNI
jgi:hypothetical protein